MACRRRGAAWRRAASHVLHNPVVLLLALLGIALVVTGFVIGLGTETGRFMARVGVWVTVLGVLVPFAKEVTIGPGGINIKSALREREAEYEAALDRHEPTTLRLAELFVGDAAHARHIAEQAWAQAYAGWHILGVEHVRPFVVCTLARLAVRASWAQPPETGDEDGTWVEFLGELPARTRAAVVLHDYELASVRRIAWILDWDEEGVRAALAVRDRTPVASGGEQG